MEPLQSSLDQSPPCTATSLDFFCALQRTHWNSCVSKWEMEVLSGNDLVASDDRNVNFPERFDERKTVVTKMDVVKLGEKIAERFVRTFCSTECPFKFGR
jgi:hypothetical protein